jgi:hypothetical protein
MRAAQFLIFSVILSTSQCHKKTHQWHISNFCVPAGGTKRLEKWSDEASTHNE